MSDERKEAQASLYALGALPPDEAREFEHSLQSDIETQLLVREFKAAADAMVLAFPRVEPPPELKQRVLAAVEARGSGGAILPLPGAAAPSWTAWVPWALAACFALLCVLLLGTGSSLRRQVTELRDEVNRLTEAATAETGQQREQAQVLIQQVTNYQQRIIELERQVVRANQEHQRATTRLEDQLRQATSQAQSQRTQLLRQVQEQQDVIEELQDLVGLSSTGIVDDMSRTQLTPLLPTSESNPRTVGAASFDLTTQQGLVVVENLPPLQGQDYQLWLFDPRFASPVSGGVFSAEGTGRVRYQFRPGVALERVTKVAVSVERKGGVQAPQGPIVLASN